MDIKEAIIKASRDFLEFNTASHLVSWVMVVFLLFCGVPQKTVAAITNYTDRRVRNIRDRFENGDFPREGKKIKKRMLGGIVKYIMDHPRSTLKDVAQYLEEEYKLEVSVKTIERELEEYASQTCTSWSGRRKSGQFT
ncbi:helix-turn-helix domain-containing protein [Methanophagales archaeon]|nr:MAG: helix-turn-helix domain-containing protein [Methanophagales archaeon]